MIVFYMRRSVRTEHGTIEYELVQTERKSMEIRVIQGGQVRVFAPKRAALKDADGFVRERAQWIVEGHRRMAEYVEKREKESTVKDGGTVLFQGEPVGVRVEIKERERVWRDDDGNIRVEVHIEEGEKVRGVIRAWMVEQARVAIEAEVAQLVPIVGRRPGRITIREQRTRWGSCSNKQNLNFNWKLVMAPSEALRYVVVHELCHLWEFNHSARFWAMVEKIQPDYIVWRDWLKKNGKLLSL